MARKTTPASASVADYRYDAKRKNIPEAGLAAQGRIEERPRLQYAYDPHLPPVLRYDSTGQADLLPELLQVATQRALTTDEARLLAEALRRQQPWLEWSGKQEARVVEVDPVALHIHERVATKAILAAAGRQDVQRSLFANDVLGYRERVQFYRHDVDWANRLILGDSLQVMASLVEREGMAGKIQTIYMDPPYGIKYASNFQPLIAKKDVGERQGDLSREPEVVKAYRDTWSLGIHTYLEYLKARLVLGRQLLTDSGSVFVQISDENLHRVRMLLDEVFGPENFMAVINFQKTGGIAANTIASTVDYLIWYARDRSCVKYHQLFEERVKGDTSLDRYDSVELRSGEQRRIAGFPEDLLKNREALRFQLVALNSDGQTSAPKPFVFRGKQYYPRQGTHWKTTEVGLERLAAAERVQQTGDGVRYKRFADDFPVVPLTDRWESTQMGTERLYAVQTASSVVERCVLMTSDPGDLVLDPTSGSGTTAIVAEKWGRRWIAIDTSRVANAIARQRLLTAVFDWYKLRNEQQGVDAGLIYKTVPHITLKAIAQNRAIDLIVNHHQPAITEKLLRLNMALAAVPGELRSHLAAKVESKRKSAGARAITEADRRRWLLPKGQWQEWEVPFDADPDWPVAMQEALYAYRQAWRAKMDDVDSVIARSAEQEELVDQPVNVPGISRVSGPFTVESVLPLEQTVDEFPSPVDGFDEELETFGGGDRDETIVPIDDDPQNAEAFVARMTDLLRKDGARFLGNQAVGFARLEPSSGSVIHAEGVWRLDSERERAVAVSFGPQYGNISALQVEQALRTASRRGFDDLLLVGFGFDDAAQAAIQDDENPNVRCHMTLIRPDVLMGDLLKTTANSQIFTVVAMPRVRLSDLPGEAFTVTMEGMDVYDPVENVLRSTGADKVAAWFLDSDYDGRTFCICQAFFPDTKAWEKLARALKGAIDEEAFAAFSGDTSLPFRAGEHGRVCVKVIDPRGNEATRVLSLSGADSYAAMAGAGSGRP